MSISQPAWARQWLAQWRGAGEALAAERKRSLASLRGDRAAEAVGLVLDLSTKVPASPRRRATSGLVQQQALFLRALHRKAT